MVEHYTPLLKDKFLFISYVLLKQNNIIINAHNKKEPATVLCNIQNYIYHYYTQILLQIAFLLHIVKLKCNSYTI